MADSEILKNIKNNILLCLSDINIIESINNGEHFVSSSYAAERLTEVKQGFMKSILNRLQKMLDDCNELGFKLGLVSVSDSDDSDSDSCDDSDSGNCNNTNSISEDDHKKYMIKCDETFSYGNLRDHLMWLYHENDMHYYNLVYCKYHDSMLKIAGAKYDKDLDSIVLECIGYFE